MATFTKLDQLADHGKYKPLLKAALAKVKEAPLRFSYFEKYKFGDKTFPLVLVDTEPALVNEIKKKLGNTTAVGKCRVNEKDELVFEPEGGTLNRARLKKYLSTFSGVREVWVPLGEVAEGPEDGAPITETKPAGQTAAPQPRAAAKQAEKPGPERPQFEARLEAVAERVRKAGPSAIVQFANPMSRARELGSQGNYAEAGKILTTLESALSKPAAKVPVAADLTAAYNQLIPVVKQAVADYPASKDKMMAAFAAIPALIKAGSVDEAQKALDRVAGLMEAAKKESAGGSEPAPRSEAARNAAMEMWQSARKQVIAELKELENKIRAMADPEGDAAIVLVKAIQANLTEKLGTLSKVAELEGYLNNDAIIKDAEAPNGFGITVNIRKPLLAALSKLKPQLVA